MNNTIIDVDERSKDYSRYQLEQNPFPYSPVPTENPDIYCGQEHVLAEINETVAAVLHTGKSRHLVVTGKYGNGKSHTLKYTRSQLRDYDEAVVGYVAQPGNGFLDVYHEFLFDLGFDWIQGLVYEFLAEVAQHQTDHDPSTGEVLKQQLNDGEVLLSELVPTAIRELSEVTNYADFARALVHMAYEETRLYAWQWLTGEGIRYEQRKKMEIHSAVDDATTSVRAFTALKQLLRHLNYTGVFVFIDEFESIARLRPKDKQATLNSLRHLMDQNSHGLCLLLGCAPEVWQDVMSEYHAFAERIGADVALRPLSEDRLETLVAAYLTPVRVDGSHGTDPFTEEALAIVLNRSQGNIRQALSLCSRLLDQALDQDCSMITADVVESTLN